MGRDDTVIPFVPKFHEPKISELPLNCPSPIAIGPRLVYSPTSIYHTTQPNVVKYMKPMGYETIDSSTHYKKNTFNHFSNMTCFDLPGFA